MAIYHWSNGSVILFKKLSVTDIYTKGRITCNIDILVILDCISSTLDDPNVSDPNFSNYIKSNTNNSMKLSHDITEQ